MSIGLCKLFLLFFIEIIFSNIIVQILKLCYYILKERHLTETDAFLMGSTPKVEPTEQSIYLSK
jgi:hypothetical protein